MVFSISFSSLPPPPISNCQFLDDVSLLQVPELAGFWLLTLLLQLPVILFLLFNEGLNIQPLERSVNIIFALFLIFQVIAAFVTLKRMVNKLATHFHLNEFDRLEEHPVRHLYGPSKEENVLPMASMAPCWGASYNKFRLGIKHLGPETLAEAGLMMLQLCSILLGHYLNFYFRDIKK